MPSVVSATVCKLTFMPRTPKTPEPSAFGLRLAEALEKTGRERKDLVEHLGVTPQSIGQVLSGSTNAMTADNCVRTARFLGVSAFWLATGEGQMLDETSAEGPPEIGSHPGEKQLLDDLRFLHPKDRDRIVAEIHSLAAELREYELFLLQRVASRNEQSISDIRHTPKNGGGVTYTEGSTGKPPAAKKQKRK